MAEREQTSMDLGFSYWTSCRRKFSPNDPFFAAGSIERELLAKQVALDLVGDGNERLQDMEPDTDEPSVFCPIVGCGFQLKSLEDFEDHYNTRHTSSCSVCSRVYPTSRLLSIHVSEVHDSFFKAKVARGFPMYECLVEGCGMKLKSYRSRQQHLIDKHKFPASFEFYKKSRSRKQDRLKYQTKKNHHQEKNMKGDMEIDAHGNSRKQTSKKMPKVEEMDMEMDQKVDELTSAVSKLNTSDSSPASIRFGHRNSRALAFVPRSIRNKKNVAPDSKK